MDRYPFSLSFRRWALFTAAMVVAGSVWADPFADIAAFSSIKADPAKVQKGEVVTARIPGITLPRGQGVESVFVVDAPLDKTFGSLHSWNGSRHSDLKVYLHGEISVPPAAGDFQKLQSAPNNSAVRSLSDAAHLQLAAGEADKVPKGSGGLTGDLAAFWSGVLEKRSRSFLSGGAPALPAYSVSGRSVSAAEEMSQLLRTVPKIQGQFRSIIGASGINGRPAGKADLYWELVNAEGEGVINLGSSTFSQDGKSSAQSVDIQYYATGNYYALVTLYQLWPIQVGGKEQTLVWRADLVSSASLEVLHGIERNAAGSALSKEIAKIIGYFQKDTAR